MKHVDWTPSLIGTDIQVASDVIVRQVFGQRVKDYFFANQAGSNITITRNALGSIITGTGGGSVSFTAVSITTSYGIQDAIVNVVDAAIGAGSKILISWGMLADTDENGPDMDDVKFNATALAGSMDVKVHCDSFIGGTFKIMYLLG